MTHSRLPRNLRNSYLVLAFAAFWSVAALAAPKEGESCVLFLKTALEKDYRTQQTADALKARYTTQDSYAANMPAALKAEREILLEMTRDRSFRQLTREAALSDLRARSAKIASRLGSVPQDSQELVFDDLIVGAGVHGSIANGVIRRSFPNRKVLVVDATDTPAYTFARLGDALELNSTGRPGLFQVNPVDEIARPGQGNLNGVPGAILQTTDLTGNRYPTGQDLADTVLYHFWSTDSDILFNTQIKSVSEVTGQAGIPAGARYRVLFSSGRSIYVRNKGTIQVTTGLGKEILPRGVKLGGGFQNDVSGAFDLVETALVGSTRQSNNAVAPATEAMARLQSGGYPAAILDGVTMPGLVPSGTFLAKMNQTQGKFLNSLAGRKILMIGEGDSAHVSLENLIRESPIHRIQAGSSIQEGVPSEIVWTTKRETCEMFASDTRPRYQRIGGAYKSGLIKPADVRVSAVNPGSQPGKISVTFTKPDGGSYSDEFDFVVAATGQADGAAQIFAPLAPKAVNAPKLTATDSVVPVIGGLPGYNGDQKLGQQLLRSTQPGDSDYLHRIYFWGPVTNQLVQPNETAGITENLASIFALGRRTARGTQIALGSSTDALKSEGALAPVANGALSDLVSIGRLNSGEVTMDLRVAVPNSARPASAIDDLYLKSKVTQSMNRVLKTNGQANTNFALTLHFEGSSVNPDLPMTVLNFDPNTSGVSRPLAESLANSFGESMSSDPYLVSIGERLAQLREGRGVVNVTGNVGADGAVQNLKVDFAVQGN